MKDFGKFIRIAITYYGNEPIRMVKWYDDEAGESLIHHFKNYKQAQLELHRLAKSLGRGIRMDVNRFDVGICTKEVYGFTKGA